MQAFFQWSKWFELYILATHKGESLDYRVFVSAVIGVGLTELLQSGCHGFVDTLPVMKRVLPGEAIQVSNLHKARTGKSFEAHDVKANVAALCTVMEKAKVSTADLKKDTSTLQSVIDRSVHLCHRLSRLVTFKEVIAAKGGTLSMAMKIAGSGLSFNGVFGVLKAKGKYSVVALFPEEAAKV